MDLRRAYNPTIAVKDAVLRARRRSPPVIPLRIRLHGPHHERIVGVVVVVDLGGAPGAVGL